MVKKSVPNPKAAKTTQTMVTKITTQAMVIKM